MCQRGRGRCETADRLDDSVYSIAREQAGNKSLGAHSIVARQ